jgi:small-conductance mechanosensitive channel
MTLQTGLGGRDRSRLAVAVLLAFWLVGSPSGALAAEPQMLPAVETPERRSAELLIANRPIFTMRAQNYGVSPDERAELVRKTVRVLVDMGGPLKVTTRPLADGVAVLIDDRIAFRVLDADVDPEAGISAPDMAAQAVQNLRKALAEMREARDARALLPAIGYSLLATVLLVGALWLVIRTYRWSAKRAHGLFERRVSRHLPDWANTVVGEAGVAGLFTLPLKLVSALAVVLLMYQWAGFVLQRFPYTRPWGEALLDNLIDGVGSFGEALIKSIPGLLFVALIFVLARIVIRAVRAFFQGVQVGQIRVGLVDETTARPTGQLVITGIWLLALVAAYPYIPGSGSEAFKGIGVFVGLMMSIGASGVVNQAVSGLMLMYTRALRAGEYVQIGETEGTVRSVGFLTTRILTLRNEEISIPNAIITSTVTRNFSRLAREGGVWVPTKVTIGYDTPWRQVHALLKMAAERTDGVSREPAPRVLQTGLQDFYVEYTLLVNLAEPSTRIATLDRLHASIQDAFNEFGVQIMSPHYLADPSTPKVVAREKWSEPPAVG